MANLLSGLALMRKLKGASPEYREAARKVGEAYSSASKRGDFFQTAPGISSTSELPSKYGTITPQVTDDPHITWIASQKSPAKGPDDPGVLGLWKGTGKDLKETFEGYQGLSDYEHLLSDDQMYGVLDAMQLSKGSGDAKNLYPAALEQMASEGVINVADPRGLTVQNIPRRGLNSVGTLLKSEGKVPIIPSSSQVLESGLSVEDFVQLPYEEQVGLYLMSGGRDALKRMASGMAEGKRRYLLGENPEFANIYSEPNLDPLSGRIGRLNPESSQESTQRVANTLYDSGVRGVGSDTLRKLHFIDQILNPEASVVPIDLVQGLERRRGGLVQMQDRRIERS